MQNKRHRLRSTSRETQDIKAEGKRRFKTSSRGQLSTTPKERKIEGKKRGSAGETPNVLQGAAM